MILREVVKYAELLVPCFMDKVFLLENQRSLLVADYEACLRENDALHAQLAAESVYTPFCELVMLFSLFFYEMQAVML